MFRRYYLIFGLLLTLTYVPTAAQDDVPPPLGYANLSDYSDRYHIYDFNTREVQTVERDVPQGEKVPYVPELPPDHVILQSPYDASTQFEWVSTSPIEPNTHIDYDLYRLASDGTRQLITSHAVVPYVENDYWSPNGDYLYIKTNTQLTGAATLSKYSLRTNSLTLLKQPILGLTDCQTAATWCIVKQLGVRDGSKYPVTLYLLDRDRGTLQRLSTSVSLFTNILWLGETSEFVYAIATSLDHYTVHHYDAATHTDKLLTELQAIQIARWQLSPDEHWLLIEASLNKTLFGRLYVLDLKAVGATPILLTEHFTHLSQSPITSLRWFDNHTLIYSTYEQKVGYSVYRAALPDGEIRELAHFDRETGFFDHDWSPDRRWLVLSQSVYRDAPATIYLVSTSGGSHEIILPQVVDHNVCVGWFAKEVYLSQKANLCDMNLGEG